MAVTTFTVSVETTKPLLSKGNLKQIASAEAKLEMWINGGLMLASMGGVNLGVKSVDVTFEQTRAR